MRSTFIAVCLIACCASEQQSTPPQKGTYVKPELSALLREVKGDWAELWAPDVQAAFEQIRNCRSYRALWSAVKDLGREGIVELYGYEYLARQPEEYRAAFFVDVGGRYLCLIADESVHEKRVDAETVPWLPIDAEGFLLLRKRMEMELPFNKDGSFVSQAHGASAWWLHVFRAGQSDSALCYGPWIMPWTMGEGDQRGYASLYSLTAALGAMRVALPIALNPDGNWGHHYSQIPGWR